MRCDVAIVGGGPAGSTVGSYLRKYAPYLRVTILERELFPRDHVGESQLPMASWILDEIGAWDAVEEAGFPIKVGATYRWGKSSELWDFNFLPDGDLKPQPRPASFAGQRRLVAFQVDRATYDKILLDHAAALGCRVLEETKVVGVESSDDRITGLMLESGEKLTAKYYVDASGHAGTIRRAMNVEVDVPTRLKNVAFWDYWDNAEWAETIGNGGTKVQVMSLGYGWIWFIPIGKTRTSVGLVTSAEYYKQSGLRPVELYHRAVQAEPRIAAFLKNATCEKKFSTTNDWSFVAKRHYGENWLLAGESGGFADPILAAGLSITHVAGKEAAFTIMALNKRELDAAWLKEQYQENQVRRVTTHIRFADYWYSANAQFGDLKEYTAEIAKEAGLTLSPDMAWRWLAQGGFIEAGFGFHTVRQWGEFMAPFDAQNTLKTCNVFRLNLEGATLGCYAEYTQGEVRRVPAYTRDGKQWPLVGVAKILHDILKDHPRLPDFQRELDVVIAKNMKRDPGFWEWMMNAGPPALEALAADGWIEGSYDPKLPLLPIGDGARPLAWKAKPLTADQALTG